MDPQTRTRFPKVLIERDTDSEQSSSNEEEEGPPSEEENENENEEKTEAFNDSKNLGKSPITISLKKVCKVCKRMGHEAGFNGATYIDCPMKPCFLCKIKPGCAPFTPFFPVYVHKSNNYIPFTPGCATINECLKWLPI